MKRGITMKKFELTDEFITILGRKLFRIKALADFSNVKAGEFGGYVEKENNLSNEGDAWVSGNARVSGNAQISGNALVSGDAQVSGNAQVSDNAQVSGNAWVSDDAQVSGNTQVYGNAQVSGNARVSGNAQISGNALVSGDADYATIKGFGTRFRNTTFFKCKNNTVKVSCGCFLGTIDEFREQVKKTRTGKIAEEYLRIADLMEFHFNNN